MLSLVVVIELAVIVGRILRVCCRRDKCVDSYDPVWVDDSSCKFREAQWTEDGDIKEAGV